jgi:hypothetical protein
MTARTALHPDDDAPDPRTAADWHHQQAVEHTALARDCDDRCRADLAAHHRQAADMHRAIGDRLRD